METKLDITPILAYNTVDIIQFLYHKKYGQKYEAGGDSEHMFFWNKCCSQVSNELMYIVYKLPEQIKIIDTSERIFKVMTDKLTIESSVLEFTKAYSSDKDYLILFTD